MHVDGWAHLHIHTPKACVHICTLTRKKPIWTSDHALSNAKRPRCLRPLEAEISRPAAVQLQSGKKLMFHLPPFHSVKRSSWGKASLNTGECFPGDVGPERARSNRFSQQEIHWVEEWSEFLGNQVFSSRVLYHESYLWSLWARQASDSHRDCLSIIDFWCCCLSSQLKNSTTVFFLFLSFTFNSPKFGAEDSKTNHKSHTFNFWLSRL